MPVFELTEHIVFPLPAFAEPDGLLAVGGDLSTDRLLAAYSMGIFPWYTEGSPILWWSPNPRLVLFPAELRVSRNLRRTVRKNIFTVTLDRAFRDVIRSCAEVHSARSGDTWITADMEAAYNRLHTEGYAHSVESWLHGELVGGLYGVSLGGVFFGESMFTKVSDASKVAFVKLTECLQKWGFEVVDCQVDTRHLRSLGARGIPRSEFMQILEAAVPRPEPAGMWKELSGCEI